LHAADIYRWVDERGQTQMSDKVPEQYRDSAQKINSGRFEVTPEQRAEAQARAAKAKEKIERDGQERRRQEASDAAAASNPADAASGPANGKPSAGDQAAACAAQWQAYLASDACFAPYRLVNGGVKSEAFQICTSVQMPSNNCHMQMPEAQ